MEVSIGQTTTEWYMSLFVEDNLAREVFDRMTTALVETLELNVSTQRRDSAHIFSAMAVFGCTKLMAVAIKQFLVQRQRHHEPLYLELPVAFQNRYALSQGKLFADLKRKGITLRQRVAEALLFLVSRYATDAAISNCPSYEAVHGRPILPALPA